MPAGLALHDGVYRIAMSYVCTNIGGVTAQVLTLAQ